VAFSNITDEIALFDRKIERVMQLDGGDFIRDMRHLLVENWLKNPRINPYIREMLVTRRRALTEFLEAIRPLRSAMVSLMDALLEEYSTLREDGEVGQRLANKSRLSTRKLRPRSSHQPPTRRLVRLPREAPSRLPEEGCKLQPMLLPLFTRVPTRRVLGNRRPGSLNAG
jgi:hypothetical protein